MPPSPGNSQKVMIVELCRRRQFIANVAATWVDQQVSDVLANYGPNVESLRIYAYGEDFAAGFQYRVNGEYTNDGTNWTAFVSSVLPGVAAAGNYVGNPYSTTSDFGLNLRFKVGTQATSGGTGGTLTLFLAITFKS